MDDDPTRRHPDVQAAIDFGIDITLLEANLRMTPTERLRQLVEMNRFQTEAQARSLPPDRLLRLEQMRLREKIASLRGPDCQDPVVDPPAAD